MKYSELCIRGKKIFEKDFYNGDIFLYTMEIWKYAGNLFIHEEHSNANQYTGKTETTFYAPLQEGIRSLQDIYGFEYHETDSEETEQQLFLMALNEIEQECGTEFHKDAVARTIQKVLQLIDGESEANHRQIIYMGQNGQPLNRDGIRLAPMYSKLNQK